MSALAVAARTERAETDTCTSAIDDALDRNNGRDHGKELGKVFHLITSFLVEVGLKRWATLLGQVRCESSQQGVMSIEACCYDLIVPRYDDLGQPGHFLGGLQDF